jgi:acetyl esterase
VDVQRAILKILARLPAPVLRIVTGPAIVGRGVTLDSVMQLLWVAGKKQPGVDTLTPPEARAALDKAALSLQADVPASVTFIDSALPGTAGEIPIRIYTPPSQGTPLPLTIFFHFGGHVIGSRAICHGFCGVLADRARTIVVNVEYRLAPEHPFPAPVEDALAAYRWALANAAALGADPARIAVAGDSAGGQLAAIVSQEAKRQTWQTPACQLLIYPWLVPYSGLASYRDFADAYPLTANIMKWFGGHYFRSEDEKKQAWAAPMNEPDLRGLPAALIFTAGFDPLRDEGEVYAARLKEAGVHVSFRCFEHLTHSFSMLGGVVPAAQQATLDIAEALAGQLHGAKR